MSAFTKRIIRFFIGSGLVIFGAWLAAFNFERGFGFLLVYATALFFGVWLALYPGILGEA